METRQVVKIGFYVKSDSLSSEENLEVYLSAKTNINNRMLFTIRDYILLSSKKFSAVNFRFTDKMLGKSPNGSLTGLLGKVNRSEVDIGVRPITINDRSTEIVGFSYPHKFYSVTFMIQQPEYSPQIFGILQTFSLSLWMTIISVFMAMSMVCYITLKSKYPFNKILLHVLAVLLRQSSVVKPSTSSENLLVYSWVVGAMFICLAYDSVFLSFVSFPPVIPIRHLPDLVKAVKRGEYHCFAAEKSAQYKMLLQSKQESINVIAKDIQNNNILYHDVFNDFFYEKKKMKLALLLDSDMADILNVGKKFVSEDRFLETAAAIAVRKDFCCKDFLERFVHRLMASGLYSKFESDKAFLGRLPQLKKFSDTENSERKLTLTDVAPAFIFLISGHFMSFLMLINELLSDHSRKKDSISKKKNKKKIIHNNFQI